MEEDTALEASQEPPGRRTASRSLAYRSLYCPAAEEKRSALKIVWNRNQRRHELPVCGEKTQAFRQRYYETVSDTEWNDWHWQIRHRITHVRELERFLNLSPDERAALDHPGTLFPFAVTPYFLSLLEKDDPSQGLRRTVIPVRQEHRHAPEESLDPLGEDNDSPVPGLVHRYPDRVLFLTTDFCSTYCRYCTRSRIVGNRRAHRIKTDRWQQALAYIEATPTVRDVLLSGGDPLTLSDDKLDWLLSRLRRIPHVEVVRIGTKVPVVLPQRITPRLVRILKRYQPLWISIHCTHPDELSPETQAACNRLADGGFPLGSQTVLLAGVNDRADILTRLFQGLMKVRVKPYYLYQCDPINGSAHFRTPVSRGLEMIKGLRGHTSGYAVPAYVIDGPGGAGKIPLLPEYVIGYDGQDLILKNYRGRLCRYPDIGQTGGRGGGGIPGAGPCGEAR